MSALPQLASPFRNHLRFAGMPAPAPGNVCYYFGTFNPIHNGHMQVAEKALDQFGFDKIVFVPAPDPPHKGAEVVPFEDRFEMIERAIDGNPRMAVTDIEKSLPTPTRTANTIAELAKTDKRARLPFLIGTDALRDLPGWARPQELIDKLTFIVASRNGDRIPASLKVDGERQKLSRKRLDVTEMGLSSTLVRNRVAAGESVTDMVPPDVDSFIRNKGLYQAPAI